MNEYAFVYQPQIIRETAEGLNRLDIRDEMLDRRELELMTSVDAESCAVVIRGLLHLQRQDPTMPITLYINSPGGEVQSGLALYDVMQAVSCPIRTVCLGMAASMGALLFIAGDEREILPHSRVMIHDPLIGAGAGGSALGGVHDLGELVADLAQLLAGGALGVNRCCRLQCVLLSQRDVCADFVLYSGSSCKRSLGQLYRADFFIFQHCRELGCCLLIQFHGIASLILRHAVR